MNVGGKETHRSSSSWTPAWKKAKRKSQQLKKPRPQTVNDFVRLPTKYVSNAKPFSVFDLTDFLLNRNNKVTEICIASGKNKTVVT